MPTTLAYIKQRTETQQCICNLRYKLHGTAFDSGVCILLQGLVTELSHFVGPVMD